MKMISSQSRKVAIPNTMTKMTAEMIEIMQKKIITAIVAFSLLAVSTWLTPAGKEREGNFSLAIMKIVRNRRDRDFVLASVGQPDNVSKQSFPQTRNIS